MFWRGTPAHGSKCRTEWLQSEHSETEPDDGELFEPPPAAIRVYISAQQSDREYPRSWCLRFFFRATAGMLPQNDAPALFRALLERVLTLAERGSFAFARDQLEFYLYSYLTDARVPPPASHSDIYRSAYSPHYRVVDARFVPLVELCKAINALMHDAQNQKRTVIAFDGRCALWQNYGRPTSFRARSMPRSYTAMIFSCLRSFARPGDLPSRAGTSTTNGLKKKCLQNFRSASRLNTVFSTARRVASHKRRV